MNRAPVRALAVALALALSALVAAVAWGLARDARADELASELLIDSAAIDGLEARLATERRSFSDLLEERDGLSELFRAQGERLERLEARSVSLTAASVGGSGSGRAEATVRVDKVAVSEPSEPTEVTEVASVPDTTVAFKIREPNAREPALSVDASCSVARLECAYDWSVRVKVVLLHQVLPDGRLFVTAESPTDGFEVTVDELEWVPPGGVPWFRSGWEVGGLAASGLVGAAVVATGGEAKDGMLAAGATYIATRGVRGIWGLLVR